MNTKRSLNNILIYCVGDSHMCAKVNFRSIKKKSLQRGKNPAFLEKLLENFKLYINLC